MKNISTSLKPFCLFFLSITIQSCEKDCAERLWYADTDGDGYGSPDNVRMDCTKPKGFVSNNLDFNDRNYSLKPSAEEIIGNDIDENGDGKFAYYLYVDNDTDGYGTVDAEIIVSDHVVKTKEDTPDGYSLSNDDCDDQNNLIHPEAEELGDFWNIDREIESYSDENCNNKYGVFIFLDEDKDGYSGYVRTAKNLSEKNKNESSEIIVHELTISEIINLKSDAIWQINDLQYVLATGDLDDTNSTVYPEATEIPDNDIDEDGNGYFAYNLYIDNDLDLFGDINSEKQEVEVQQVLNNENIPNGFALNNSDCDDNNSNVNPNSTEIIGNNVDENCDGIFEYEFYADEDNDGYGGQNSEIIYSEIIIQNQQDVPEGYFYESLDCDDNDPNVNPDTAEIQDNIDNDCDGIVDEVEIPDNHEDEDNDGYYAYHLYIDQDQDGYGTTPLTLIESGNKILEEKDTPKGYSLNQKDCDDNNSNINPGTTEIDDGVDNDCDGRVDEAPEIPDNAIDEDLDGYYEFSLYPDNDNDGFGQNGATIVVIKSSTIIRQESDTPANYSLNNTDCNDNDDTVNPNAVEVNDGIDNDCDGIIDGVEVPDNHIDEDQNGFYDYNLYTDADNDGYGDAAEGTTLIQHSNPILQESDTPTGHSLNNNDCDDSNGSINPGADEFIMSFQEHFTTSIPGTWSTINASHPIGTTNFAWVNNFGGVTQSDFDAADGSAGSKISNWLISPEVTLKNGDEIKFWYYVYDQTWADRFQVRISQEGSSSVLPIVGQPNTEGDFTILLQDLNPNEQNSFLEAGRWREITIQISELSSENQSCKIAFRHLISDAGVNGNTILIDNVRVFTKSNCE